MLCEICTGLFSVGAMTRLSERAGKNRLAIFGGLAGIFAAAWLLLGDHDIELIGEEFVTSTVVAIPSQKEAGQKAGIGIIVVELPEGGRARIFAPLKDVEVGAALPVKVKRFDDGSQEVAGLAAKPPNEETF